MDIYELSASEREERRMQPQSECEWHFKRTALTALATVSVLAAHAFAAPRAANGDAIVLGCSTREVVHREGRNEETRDLDLGTSSTKLKISDANISHWDEKTSRWIYSSCLGDQDLQQQYGRCKVSITLQKLEYKFEQTNPEELANGNEQHFAGDTTIDRMTGAYDEVRGLTVTSAAGEVINQTVWHRTGTCNLTSDQNSKAEL
jgi:hypothetical protein